MRKTPIPVDGISPLGQERAEAFKNYFLNFAVDSKPREPNVVFAAKDSKRAIGRVLQWNRSQKQQI